MLGKLCSFAVSVAFLTTIGLEEGLRSGEALLLRELEAGMLVPFPILRGSSSRDVHCFSFVRKFGRSASEFVECAVVYSRPFRLCEACVRSYDRTRVSYDELSRQGSNCSQSWLNSDPVQVLTKFRDNLKTLWDTAFCENCYESIKQFPNSTTRVLNNSTLKFIDHFRKFKGCINGNKTDWNTITENNRTQGSYLCQNCSRQYIKLNDLFQSIEKTLPSSVCMDVIDRINYTRLVWSSYLHCSQRPVEKTLIIIISSVVCMVPFVFYPCVWLLGRKRENGKQTLKPDRKANLYKSMGTTSTVNTPVSLN